jgi:hypothetical protein
LGTNQKYMESNRAVNYLIDSVCTPNEKPDNLKEGQLWATHSGVLDIEGFKMKCYVLSDGTRIFDKDDVEAFFGKNNLR